MSNNDTEQTTRNETVSLNTFAHNAKGRSRRHSVGCRDVRLSGCKFALERNEITLDVIRTGCWCILGCLHVVGTLVETNRGSFQVEVSQERPNMIRERTNAWSTIFSYTMYFLSLMYTVGGLCCSGRRQTPDQKISDGIVGIGKIPIAGLYLGADSATVAKALGLPDSSQSISSSRGFRRGGISAWHYSQYILFVDTSGFLLGVSLTGSGIKTSEGLQVGDSIERVRELYGESDDDYGLPQARLRYAIQGLPHLGMVIQIENGNVRSIYLGRLF